MPGRRRHADNALLATLKSKEIGGSMHYFVPCMTCGEPVWTSLGWVSDTGMNIRGCDDCKGVMHGRCPSKDEASAADRQYHGFAE